MYKSDDQDKAMLDAALALYNKQDCTRGDLLLSEAIFLELLHDRVARDGADSENVGYIHNQLGLVYAEMDDRLDEGEAHYLKAFANYTGDDNKAIIAANHAKLLVTKAKLILEKAEDLKEDARVKPAVSKTQQSALRILRETVADLRAAIAKAEKAKSSDSSKTKAKSSDSSKTKAKSKAEPTIYRSPSEIVAFLDEMVIGQRAAKRGLANAASQHLRRMKLSPEDLAKTDKSNVLISGPTGCGKTLLAQALAGAINAPYYRTEATKLTAAGYVGEDVQAILLGLLRACDFDVERAQNGIVYLDEIDKIAAAGDYYLDVGGESVQDELLTILEGTVVSVPRDGNKRSQGESVEIDTTNILFILGGAFGKLGEIVARRKASEKSSIGFGADVQSMEADFSRYQKDAEAQDFIELGMIPEFIGRLPIRLSVETLTVNQLERILVEPNKALVMQKVLLLSPTTDLRFTKGALRTIAEEAQESGTNGRALREIMEEVLAPVIFDEPKVAIIDADMVKNRKAEAAARNKLDAGVTASHDSSYIIEDGDVEAVREQAEAAAAVAADNERKARDRRVPALVQKQVG